MKIRSFRDFIVVVVTFFIVLAVGEGTIDKMGQKDLKKELKKETLISTPKGYKFNYLETEEIGDNKEEFKYKFYYFKDGSWQYLASYNEKPEVDAIYEDKSIIVYRINLETDELILIDKIDKSAQDLTAYIANNINNINEYEVRSDLLLNSAKNFLLDYECVNEKYESRFNNIIEIMRAEEQS